VDRAGSIDGLVNIPRILFELFVAKAQTTVLFVYFENDDVDVGTNCSEF
jgi:hypothetical protein